MKTRIYTSIIVMTLMMMVHSIAFEIWDDFDSRTWNPTFGTEQPIVAMDSITFSGKTVLSLAFSGNGSHGYGFMNTNWFSRENWSDVTAVNVDIYYGDNTSGNTPLCKLEVKNASGISYEQVYSPTLLKNTWQRITFPINTTLGYNTVAQIWMTIDVFNGYNTMTAYFDNIRLVYNTGVIEPWETFNDNIRNYSYGGSYDTSQYSNVPYEIRSHRHTWSENPGGAGYLSWSWISAPQPTYAELAATGFIEDWSKYSTLRYDVYTSNTSARYKIFMWDGFTGFAPVSQIVPVPNTWTRLQFDISSGAVYAQNTSFNRGHITEFKCVVEYLDVAGAGSGEAYFDNIVRYQSAPTFVESWLRLED